MKSAAHSEGHRHHWHIEEPVGETSDGKCLTCGATKTFRNWIKEADYLTQTEKRLTIGS